MNRIFQAFAASVGPFAIGVAVGCVPIKGLEMPSGWPPAGFGQEEAAAEEDRPRERRSRKEHRAQEERRSEERDTWADVPPEFDDYETQRKRETVAENEASDIGATCNRNSDCQMKACVTYGRNLGYCSKMCNSFVDCPAHWDCKRPRNAPQKICMQRD
ncbi:hypothetical protein ACFL6C_00070 [Myxococcota bacterium]